MLTGRLQNCWHLSSAASRTCVALGGRYFASLASGPSTDEAMEARYCLTLCYMFDKSLSLSMNRASCLPDMELDVFMLVPATPDRPFTALINIFLELAQVQDGIVRDTKTRGSSNVRLERIQALQQKMWQIRDRMQEVSLVVAALGRARERDFLTAMTKYTSCRVGPQLTFSDYSSDHSLPITRKVISSESGWGLSLPIIRFYLPLCGFIHTCNGTPDYRTSSCVMLGCP